MRRRASYTSCVFCSGSRFFEIFCSSDQGYADDEAVVRKGPGEYVPRTVSRSRLPKTNGAERARSPEALLAGCVAAQSIDADRPIAGVGPLHQRGPGTLHAPHRANAAHPFAIAKEMRIPAGSLAFASKAWAEASQFVTWKADGRQLFRPALVWTGIDSLTSPLIAIRRLTLVVPRTPQPWAKLASSGATVGSKNARDTEVVTRSTSRDTCNTRVGHGAPKGAIGAILTESTGPFRALETTFIAYSWCVDWDRELLQHHAC